MGLKIKTFNEILDNMANWIKSNNIRMSNFRVGSVVRTLIESVALEIELLYYKMLSGFNVAVEESIFNSFDFEKVESTYASGEVTISFKRALTQSLQIPKGFQFRTTFTQWDTLVYETTEMTVCNPGIEEITVQVRCNQPGLVGNLPAGMVTVIVNPSMLMDQAVNLRAMTGGMPAESLEERKKRFTHYIQTLVKGTIGAVQYGCLSVPGVAGAYIEEKVGYLNIYIHDSHGALPDKLKAELEATLIDYKAAGVQIILKEVVKVPVDLNISVVLDRNINPQHIRDYENTVVISVTEFLNSYGVARNLLRTDLIRHIMSIDENIIVNTDINMDKDKEVDIMELIQAGTIRVTAEIE